MADAERNDKGRLDSPDRHWLLIEEDGLLILYVIGDVIDEVDEAYETAVLDRVGSYRGSHILIDFQRCTNLASISLGFLVHFQRRAAETGKQVCWTGARGQVDNLLRVLGIHRLMTRVTGRGVIYA